VYKTFVGKLPDTVIEFKEKLHKLFPVVLDTKYMATQNQGTSAMRPASGLGELCEIMKNQTLPSICLTEKHGSYDGTVRDHEAGYDSKYSVPCNMVSIFNKWSLMSAKAG